MSRPSEHPHLTPQFCFNQTALRDFLRISRSSIDDSITQNLNALLTPAKDGFDPSSTSVRQIQSVSKRAIPIDSCRAFQDRVLFPSWKIRSDVLDYCAGVATSPDPDDPDSVLRQVEDSRARERYVNERLDPYSDRYFPREARTESLAVLMRNERAVEKIIRSRSWSLVGERCSPSSDSAEEAFDKWRVRQPRP
ncbi:caffeine-induced death protein 2 [Clohesyomyces aquaticus]|uniref:Caffeine-induced death protein 2 n=1 Tax=Clohesyomyces aquaticus TaxID=1231657 RepID=A0A1Y1ZZC4_9PLEO|nr:caffeine-induced death protein 2 [Clohesyomyces aquaticus]